MFNTLRGSVYEIIEERKHDFPVTRLVIKIMNILVLNILLLIDQSKK